MGAWLTEEVDTYRGVHFQRWSIWLARILAAGWIVYLAWVILT